jgi:hypothetical protein
MKGVVIGNVVSVALSPSGVHARAEVADAANVIPQGSRVDINLLGLAADPWIDITPPLAGAAAVRRGHGPHHPACRSEGLIVCHDGHISGQQGGSTDFMMKVRGRWRRVACRAGAARRLTRRVVDGHQHARTGKRPTSPPLPPSSSLLKHAAACSTCRGLLGCPAHAVFPVAARPHACEDGRHTVPRQDGVNEQQLPRAGVRCNTLL